MSTRVPAGITARNPIGQGGWWRLQRHNAGRKVRSHVGELCPPRQADGTLKEEPRTSLRLPKRTTKAAASNSTTADYARFMQMILNNEGRSRPAEHSGSEDGGIDVDKSAALVVFMLFDVLLLRVGLRQFHGKGCQFALGVEFAPGLNEIDYDFKKSAT
jgi:hypothetical protein